jgi:PAS domain-containing protein
MSDPKLTVSASEQAAQQVNDLFDSAELAKAIETEEFRHFLDHIPIAIAVAKSMRGEHRIVYANKAFEKVTSRAFADIGGRGWSILDVFKQEDRRIPGHLPTIRSAASAHRGLYGHH